MFRRFKGHTNPVDDRIGNEFILASCVSFRKLGMRDQTERHLKVGDGDFELDHITRTFCAVSGPVSSKHHHQSCCQCNHCCCNGQPRSAWSITFPAKPQGWFSGPCKSTTKCICCRICRDRRIFHCIASISASTSVMPLLLAT